jgi:hypothetical protein
MMSALRRNLILLVVLILVISTSSCNFTSQPTEEGIEPPEKPAPTVTTFHNLPEGEQIVTASDGASLTVPAGALSEDAAVAMEPLTFTDL